LTITERETCDRGLAQGLTDQDSGCSWSAGQHLHAPADLLMATDHRVELALARLLRQVDGVLLESFVLGLPRRDGQFWTPDAARIA